MNFFKTKLSLEPYIDPKIYEYLRKNPEKQRIHGEVQLLTVITFAFYPPTKENWAGPYVELYSKAIDLLLDHDATIVNISGTTILCCYNYPFRTNDHAAKACEAALEVISLYNQNYKNELLLRIGISTGKAIAGIIGSANLMSFSILGDHVAITEDIVFESKPADSEVIITESTKEIVQDLYEIEEYREFTFGDTLVKLFKLIK
ncbi:MAG: adenylate/guanylate cyclase domain-containing protein [Nitrospinales bacterium]